MRFLNTSTGEIFNMDSSRSMVLFMRKCRGLELLYKKLSNEALPVMFYFLTLTLSSDNLGKQNKDLHKLLNFLSMRCKRAGIPFYYVWVPEIQKKRLKKYNEVAIHWHIVVLSLQYAFPNVEYLKHAKKHYHTIYDGFAVSINALWKRWGYGQVFCEEAYSMNIRGYLAKYMSKDENLQILGGLRRFGGSNMKYYTYPNWAFFYVCANAPNFDVNTHMKGSKLYIEYKDGTKEIFKSPYKRLGGTDVNN